MKINKARKVILSIGVLVWHIWFANCAKSLGNDSPGFIVFGYLLIGALVLIPTAILYFVWGEKDKG